MNAKNIANFYFKALDYPTRQWKAGKITDSEYNKYISEAYQKLRNLGLSDEKAKEILEDIREAAA